MKFSGLVLLCMFSQLYAAEIYGTVKDETGTPLPFANIYIKGTTVGCATNENGYYSFLVERGNYTIVYQYIGYQKQEIEISITDERREMNIVLMYESTILDDVVIEDAGNPAMRIMRETIARREEHLKELQEYTCDVYMKGLQEITYIPEFYKTPEVESVFDLDSNGAGIVYLSESSSKFSFMYPDKTKELMYASKRSGDNSQFSWNDARAMLFNIYANDLNWAGLSERNFVSPISDNAFFFYNYELLGSFTENDFIIYKIKVIPKRKNDPALSGELYITSADYRIFSHQLSVTKENGIDFIDTFTVKQEFVPVENKWPALSTQYSFSYTILGIKGRGYAHAFYKDYNLHPVFGKNYFDSEISKIQDKANEKETTYWDSIRPVPLTTLEQFDYKRKDSIYEIKNTDAYKDSIDRQSNKFMPVNLITGYAYRNSRKDFIITTPPLPDILQFNTVEGYTLQPSFTIIKNLEYEKEIRFSPSFHYGFASGMLGATVSIKHEYNPVKFASFEFSGGKAFAQMNETGISPGLNSTYTLLLEKNFLKLYEKNFISANHSFEVINGLYLVTEAEYAHRKQLWNASSISPYFDNEARNFTSNNFPFAPDTALVPMQDAFSLSATFKYVIAQKYSSLPHKKYIAETKYPTLQFTYKKAVPGFFGSTVAYDFIQLRVDDNIRLNLAGNFQYTLLGGAFFHTKNMSITDMKHFEGNETLFAKTSSTKFFNLPYYSFSTDKPFAEAHISYHTEGFLFNKLPLFKQMKLQPVFSFNALFTDDSMGNYYEIAFGIEHLFKFFRLDLSYTPYNFSEIYPGTSPFRLTLGIGF